MSNLSILDRNIIAGLDSEEAEAAYLRARDRAVPLVAEMFAYEARDLVVVIKPALAASARTYGLADVPTGLLDFMLNRHFYSRFPAAGGAA